MSALASSVRKFKVTRFVAASSHYCGMGDVYNFERDASWSVSCWFKRTSGTTLVSRVLASGNFSGWQLTVSGNVFWRVGFGASVGQSAEVRTTATISDGAWHHVVATYDGSSDVSGMHIYVDGADAALTTVDNDLASSILNAGPFNIGARDNGGSGFTGDIHDVGIFDGVLDSDDVAALYGGGTPPDVLALSLSTGAPLSYWVLGEHVGDTGDVAAGATSGTSVPDLGSNGFDGTLTNGPTTVTRA